MSQEYSFTLTIPITDLPVAQDFLEQVSRTFPDTRISRKTNRQEYARFYLSFPFSSSRPDLAFQEWFFSHRHDNWDLFGPTYGRWGLA